MESGIIDVEIGLSDEERAVRDTAHRFAEEVLRPVGAALDRLPDPQSVIGAGSPLWQVHEKYRDLGLDFLEGVGQVGPEALAAARLRSLVLEEFGWGDAGLGLGLMVAGFPGMFATMSGNPALIERFAGADGRRGRYTRHEIGCWAATEPDHGSDLINALDSAVASSTGRWNCIAERAGDEYVIRGQKSAWVSNGSVADVAALYCAMAPGDDSRRFAIALVPLDLPGVTRGKPLDKIGQRTLNQGEIFFDDVRISADCVVVTPETYVPVSESVLTMANGAMSAVFTGVARAALEHAVDYAKQRVQGGAPIIRHQSVKARLFRMFSQFEAARSLSRRVMAYNATNPPQLHYSIAAKVVCTTAAFEIASGALQIFGGNGLSREYPIEKLLRDARASMIEDGCNDVLSLVGAGRL
ncbi:MAG: acyl-CoA dehydrogenase [Deltaproteobacteria bacterium]|nr:acyl-CoA dehydrogenase [Deltaproteobacteria bacterium]